MNKEIKELTDTEVAVEFSEIIREKMTEEQFWKWVSFWFDSDVMCRTAEEWDIEDQRETLKELRNMIK